MKIKILLAYLEKLLYLCAVGCRLTIGEIRRKSTSAVPRWGAALMLGEIAPRVRPDGCKLGIGSAEHRTPLLDDIQRNERCFEPECNFGKWMKMGCRNMILTQWTKKKCTRPIRVSRLVSRCYLSREWTDSYFLLRIKAKASLYPKHIYFNDLKYFGWQLIIIVQEVQFTNEYKPQNNARILLNHEVWYK